MKLNKSLNIHSIIESCNNHTSQQELYHILNGVNRGTLEHIIKHYCQGVSYQDNTIDYLAHYCLSRPHQQYSISKIKGNRGLSFSIEGKVGETIKQIGNDGIQMLTTLGNWNKNDYITLNNICSKLHSIYYILRHINDNHNRESLDQTIKMIEEIWLDIIHIIIVDFLQKIGQDQGNHTIEYQCKNRSINTYYTNKFIVKYDIHKIDTTTLYHYLTIKMGPGISDHIIENNILTLLTTLINQKNYHKSHINTILQTHYTSLLRE